MKRFGSFEKNWQLVVVFIVAMMVGMAVTSVAQAGF